jgi:hypothetical protein
MADEKRVGTALSADGMRPSREGEYTAGLGVVLGC